MLSNYFKSSYRSILTTALIVFCSLLFANPAFAGIDDDKYDGNVFVLYAGNGSLVPAKISLADSLKAKKPALLVYYVDDSTDCKKYSAVISQLQAYYGKAASFIPVTVDSLALDKKYQNTEEGYYYGGTVPQTVVVDKADLRADTDLLALADMKGAGDRDTVDHAALPAAAAACDLAAE